MPKTNHPNTQNPPTRAVIAAARAGRRFFSTGRQRELYDSLLGAPCPASDDDSDADRLTLLGGDAPPIPESVCGAS